MSRALDEWVGKTDDAKIPDRVRDRIFKMQNGFCEECHRQLGGADRPEYDHRVALINGGEHRETNLRMLCAWCHKAKTRTDVGQKARDYRKRAKNNGTGSRIRTITRWRRFDGSIVTASRER